MTDEAHRKLNFFEWGPSLRPDYDSARFTESDRRAVKGCHSETYVGVDGVCDQETAAAFMHRAQAHHKYRQALFAMRDAIDTEIKATAEDGPVFTDLFAEWDKVLKAMAHSPGSPLTVLSHEVAVPLLLLDQVPSGTPDSEVVDYFTKSLYAEIVLKAQEMRLRPVGPVTIEWHEGPAAFSAKTVRLRTYGQPE